MKENNPPELFTKELAAKWCEMIFREIRLTDLGVSFEKGATVWDVLESAKQKERVVDIFHRFLYCVLPRENDPDKKQSAEKKRKFSNAAKAIKEVLTLDHSEEIRKQLDDLRGNLLFREVVSGFNLYDSVTQSLLPALALIVEKAVLHLFPKVNGKRLASSTRSVVSSIENELSHFWDFDLKDTEGTTARELFNQRKVGLRKGLVHLDYVEEMTTSGDPDYIIPDLDPWPKNMRTPTSLLFPLHSALSSIHWIDRF